MSLFARFEEEDVVAGMEVCEGVEGAVVVVAGFRVEFRVKVRVREQVVEVLEEVSVPVSGLAWSKCEHCGCLVPEGNTARSEHQDAVAEFRGYLLQLVGCDLFFFFLLFAC